MFVERVDQRDEARRFVAVLGPHTRDADEDHGVEGARDGKIVGRAARLAAKPLEAEHRDAFQQPGHEELAAIDVDLA